MYGAKRVMQLKFYTKRFSTSRERVSNEGNLKRKAHLERSSYSLGSGHQSLEVINSHPK